MALLWPESDSERARNLLKSSVYVVRKALGEDAIRSEGEHLRLDPEAVRADVTEFEAAVERGDLAAAVALQTGPLLEGFFLPDAQEFEQLVDGERRRLVAALGTARENLAEAAEARGDLRSAAEQWQALATQDPYDSRVALRFMRVMEASGNPAGALRHASVHARLLAEEYGLEPAAEVAALAARIRERSAGREPSGSDPLDERLTGVQPEPGTRDSVERTAGMAPDGDGGESPGGLSSHVRAAHPPADAGVARVATARRQKLVVVLVAMGLTVGGALAAWSGLGHGRAQGGEPTIPLVAVLPLRDLSTGSENSRLADGVTDELITTVSQAGVRVVASTSVYAFRERAMDVRAIADSLGVDHVLEGDLQRTGSRVRVRVRLVDARDGSTVWSAAYDRELMDVFAVQQDIASTVARELGVRLASVPRRRPPTTSVAAYDLYLRGSDPTLFRSDSAARRGLDYFRQAIELDPNYAAAWAGLATMYMRVGADAAPDPDRDFELAEEAALRAVALDSSLAEAQTTLGALRLTRFDFESAERHLGRAIDLDPARSLTHQWMVALYLWTARPDLALDHAERSLELDPLSPSAHAELARALIGNGRCEEAMDRLERLASLRPPLLRVPLLLAQCHAVAGRWSEAESALRPLAEQNYSIRGQLGLVLAGAGRRAEAVDIRNALEDARERGERTALGLAFVTAGLGDVDASLTWLERSVEDRSLTGVGVHFVELLLWSPLLREVREDPRFDAWLGALRPPPSEAVA